MPKVRLRNGINIHYLRVGEGPDLVMLHGLTGNLAVWHLKMVPILRDHFRVLTYDFRGHGHSDIPPSGYTTGDMADDLDQLLDALDLESCCLVGHSYGADTALYFSLTRPKRVKQVVAIEAGLAALIQLRDRDDWEGWAHWARLLEQLGTPVPVDRRTDIDYMLRLSLGVPKIFGPAIGHTRKAEPLLKLLGTTMVKDYEVVGELTIQNLARITTPVTLIYGEGSAFLGTYDYLMSHLPSVTGVMLPPTQLGGHFGVLEQPELLIDNLLKYLLPGAARPAIVPSLVSR
jgi:pimeloyl-ACP methyl ester carboxylesterase